MSGFFGQAAGLIFQGVSAAKKKVANLSNEWGSGIKWMTLKEGQEQAKKEGKPVMIIIHRQSCPACISLKPKFASSDDIRRLSQRFIMINVSAATERLPSRFSPGGASYVPRILFTDPSGDVLEEVRSENNQYKYFYGSSNKAIRQIVAAMSEVAEAIQPPADGPRGPAQAGKRPKRAGRWS